jgi:hypothetical protein
MLYLQIKYARMVAQTLERAKLKSESPFHINSRCKICGDSATNKSKTRFHIRDHKGVIFCSCFNCGYSNSLVNYMKMYEPSLYNEYTFEKFKVNGNDSDPVITFKPTEEPTIIASAAIFTLPLVLVSTLDENSVVSRYVASRHLPDYPFQYCENFFKFSSQFNPILGNMEKDEPRLIIPFFDRKGNVYAYQGRDLSGKSKLKYITVIVNPKIPLVFGIDRVDFKKPLYIVEGPIDSLFLPNCVASVNASLVATAKKMKAAININSTVLVLDNEPRNSVICKIYENAIKEGYRVVIWPKSVDGKKDINDLVLAGLDPIKIIAKNTYSGLMADLQFKQWKKV